LKIISLLINNFLSFQDYEKPIEFESFNIIVGPNGVGKSNIFRALQVMNSALNQYGRNISYFDLMGEKYAPINLHIEAKLELDYEEQLILANRILFCFISEGAINQETEMWIKDNVINIFSSLQKDLMNLFNEITIIIKADQKDPRYLYYMYKVEAEGISYFIENDQIWASTKGEYYLKGFSLIKLYKAYHEEINSDQSYIKEEIPKLSKI